MSDDRVVKVGDVWATSIVKVTRIEYDNVGNSWAWSGTRCFMRIASDGAPLSSEWYLVCRADDPLDAVAALVRLRELADTGVIDLDLALRSVGR